MTVCSLSVNICSVVVSGLFGNLSQDHFSSFDRTGIKCLELNVCFKKTGTKYSSVLLLRFVPVIFETDVTWNFPIPSKLEKPEIKLSLQVSASTKTFLIMQVIKF